ncbi:MAG: hypothetical protein ABGX04_00635 [Myxococcales bacterium]|nr:hypothetical protein [Myxococcales bacterium]HIK86797.1 hypothetical protein [Myxococcales bacterium]
MGDSIILNFPIPFQDEALKRGWSASVKGLVGCTQVESERSLRPNNSVSPRGADERFLPAAELRPAVTFFDTGSMI